MRSLAATLTPEAAELIRTRSGIEAPLGVDVIAVGQITVRGEPR